MSAFHKARREARRVLQQAKVYKAPVPVNKIARKYASDLIFRPMSDDISGMLIPISKDSWVIVVNSTHPEVRQRFTIAHELGHLLLHGYVTPHADRAFKIRRRDTQSSDGSVLEEIEANQFASELLMPETILIEKLRGEGLEYAPIAEDDSQLAELAREFQVSKQAISIRLSTLLV